MPLTGKGEKVMKNMTKQYGKTKGKQVFYAAANSGKITGVHEQLAKFQKNLVRRNKRSR